MKISDFSVKPLMAVAVAVVAGLSAPALAGNDSVSTRFGTVGVSANLLTFNGAPVSPHVAGNNSIDLNHTVYQVGDVDAVLVGDIGGSMCPERFWVALVSKAGVRMSPEFGTCSEDVSVKAVGGKLNLIQPAFAFRGMPAPPAGKVETFVVDPVSGGVTHDGMLVK